MSYPDFGDPVYLPRVTAGHLPNLYFRQPGNANSTPPGILFPDGVVICSDGSTNDLYAVRIEEDGSCTAGAAFPTLDPDANGPSFVGVYWDGTQTQILTVDTSDASGGNVTQRIRQMVVDPDTLDITLQDTESHVNPAAGSPDNPNSPVLNPLGGIVYSANDYTSTQTSHKTWVTPIATGGIGPKADGDLLSTTGMTGFDIGFLFILSENQYFSSHGRYWVQETDGTITDQPVDGGDLDSIYNSYDIKHWGNVAGLFTIPEFAGDGGDSLGVVDMAGEVTTYDMSDIIQDPGGDFPGEVWYNRSIWEYAGTTYVASYHYDEVVLAITADPLGDPVTYFIREEEYVALRPSGMTPAGLIFATGEHSADPDHADYYTYAIPSLPCFTPSEYTWGNAGEPAEHAALGTGATGTDVLTPGNDASYAEAWAVDNDNFDYLIFRYMEDVPVGVVADESDVNVVVRLSVEDDGTDPGEHQLQIDMYDTDPAGPFLATWTYSVPEGGTIYDLTLPLDEHADYDTDYWSEFVNGTPGEDPQDDPWATVANLMRTGSLTVRVGRVANDPGRTWTEGAVTVYSFALCMPEDSGLVTPSGDVPIWMQSGVYSADQERVITGLMFDRAISKQSNGDALVTAGQGGVVGHLNSLKPSVTGSDMNFTVQPGVVMVPQMGPPYGAYICHNQGPFTGTIDPELGSDPRIDLLVADVDPATGDWAFVVIAGTPAVNPLTPTPGAEQVAIASFRVIPAALNGGTNKINGSGLVDLRSFQAAQGGIHIVGNGATQPTYGPGRLVYDYSTRTLNMASTPYPTFQMWRDYVAPYRARSAYDMSFRSTRSNSWTPDIQEVSYATAQNFVNGTGATAFGPQIAPVTVTGVSSPIGAFKVTFGATMKVPFPGGGSGLGEARAMVGYSANQPGFAGSIPVSDAWSAAARIVGYPTWARRHSTFIAEGFVTNQPVDFKLHFRTDVSGAFVFFHAPLLLVEPFL